MSKSYITFSAADTADDDFMIEWLLLAAQTAPAKKKRRSGGIRDRRLRVAYLEAATGVR